VKTRNYVIALLIVATAMAAIETNTSPVSADACAAQLTYPIMPVSYTYSNVPIVVPISAVCTTNYGSQLYATGTAYDINLGVGLGSVSTVMNSVNEGTIFNGQLGFNLPPSTQGHSVQISVSIYNGQYGSLITSATETIQVGNTTQQYVTTTVTQQVPYPDPYQSQPYQSPFASAFQNLSRFQLFQRQQQYQAQRSDNTTMLSYVAIAAILAAVVIATAGLVAYGRRQQNWPAMQPPAR
jgi:hypothetical protein